MISQAAQTARPQFFERKPGPVVEKVDNTIHWINQYPLDRAIDFTMTYPLDGDLSGG